MKLSPAFQRILGTILFVFGVASLAVPFLPGWIFIGVGLYILSLHSERTERYVVAVRRRSRHFDRIMVIIYDKFKAREDEKEDEEI